MGAAHQGRQGGAEEQERERGADKDRREDEIGTEIVLGIEDVDAKAPSRAGIFGKDGADHGIGDGNAQARKEVGQSKGQAGHGEDTPARGAHGGQKSRDITVGSFITLGEGDRHGEEGDERDQRDFGCEAEAEPQNDQRRDGDKRQGLGDDED
ncbi:hypothetical protein ASD83_18280 [Devosia sp. Root685]|nr:hypothetical protein ASD83_18280 [Devosia sp. Root685]